MSNYYITITTVKWLSINGSKLIWTLEDGAEVWMAWIEMNFTVKHDRSGRNLPSLRRSRGNSHLLLSYCRRSFCSSSGHSSGSIMMDGPILYWAGCWEDPHSFNESHFYLQQQSRAGKKWMTQFELWAYDKSWGQRDKNTLWWLSFFHHQHCWFPFEEIWLIHTQLYASIHTTI